MDAWQQQAMAQSSRKWAEQQLRGIEAALRRCNEGSYGICAECDEPIAAARLEFDPAVQYCIKCASEAE